MGGAGVSAGPVSQHTCIVRVRTHEAVSRTAPAGEPGHVSLSNGHAKVVGWGKTRTEADGDIAVVATPSQQYLDMPVLSNRECVDKFKTMFGVNLTNSIRFLTGSV